jgi:hypothetical protein
MTPDEAHLLATAELNKIRSSVIEVERILRVLHLQRHPMPPPPLDTKPTEPLSPEVRAAIDETP